MSLERVETAPRLNPMDLKELTNAKPPCITISIPFDNPAAAQIRLKNFLREAEQQLPREQRALLEPLHDAAAEPSGRGLVLFRSPDVFTTIWLQRPIAEALTIADHFQIRGILPQLIGEQKFYILALAQKDVRLLRCTDHSSEEEPLPPGTPRSFDQLYAPAELEHVRDNMSAPAEHLKHFYRAVEAGVLEVLRRDPAPLVLVGVEYELAIYHAIDAYDRTVPGGVHGAPDGLKGGEMHARALELVEPTFEEPLRKALEIFESVAPERRATNAKEIVKAAFDARIAHLFLNETGEYHGWFREATGEVKHGKAEGIGEEDLLNAAAVRTIAGGGNVFVLPGNRMPNGAPAAAVFRW
jgi:hypothetical protein